MLKSCVAGIIFAGLLNCSAAAEMLDHTPRIAVMSAFEPELSLLQTFLTDRKDSAVNGTSFATGVLKGKDVVLFVTGVSMVNAAMTSQLALDHFDITDIVFSGIGGGVDPQRSIGDVIIPAQWGEYLDVVLAREVDGQFVPPPFIETLFDNFGMIFPSASNAAGGSKGLADDFWFAVDPDLLKVAQKVAGEVSLDNCPPDADCFVAPPGIYVGGNGVSGAAFVDNAAFRDYAFKTFSAEVLDMESAAVAHVAYVNDVPFIAFRSLSDLAGGGSGANEMETFLTLAATNSAAVVLAFVEALPE